MLLTRHELTHAHPAFLQPQAIIEGCGKLNFIHQNLTKTPVSIKCLFLSLHPSPHKTDCVIFIILFFFSFLQCWSDGVAKIEPVLVTRLAIASVCCVCTEGRWPRTPRQFPVACLGVGTGQSLSLGDREWSGLEKGRARWLRRPLGPPWESWWGEGMASAGRCCTRAQATEGGHRPFGPLGWLLASRCG